MRNSATALLAAVVLSLIPFPGAAEEGKKMDDLFIASPAFEDQGLIPPKYTCDGADVNPPLSIGNIPVKTKSLALVVDDPDAPMGTWVHWVMWNMGPGVDSVPENSIPKGALQGTNDFRKQGYGGPCPPSGTHRYYFKLYALDAPLALQPGATKAQLEQAMKGHLLGKAELIGLYRRK
ncbi:MAG: YbhB/YbcL family Raf kinase inhibitor-like protein [Deltaproteobacteria bacterium]|nr:YbhB/YbcL family Raf kinase inhibitor-like protein [Deltaproteobacteria bacterium]